MNENDTWGCWQWGANGWRRVTGWVGGAKSAEHMYWDCPVPWEEGDGGQTGPSTAQDTFCSLAICGTPGTRDRGDPAPLPLVSCPPPWHSMGQSFRAPLSAQQGHRLGEVAEMVKGPGRLGM